jgi:AcrR family transcriptional regulator
MANLMAKRKTLVDSMMRDAIYEGAVAVLAKYGLVGATMDRVAAAAGVAKGSLYNYFRSKDELLTFVYEKTMKPLHDANEQIAAGNTTAAEKIEAMIQSWRWYIREHRATFQIFIRNAAVEGVLQEASMKGEQAAIALIAEIIAQGIQAGEFRPVNARYVGEMLLAAAKGMLEAEFAEGTQRSDEETIDTLIAVFLHGLCAN